MNARLLELLGGGGERPLATDDAGATLTYRGALEALAGAELPLPPGKRLVVLELDNTVPSVRALLALLGRGHAVILVAPGLDAARRADLVARFRPDAVGAPDRGTWEVLEPGTPRPLHPSLGPLLSTSGSTGSPKLARFTVEALLANGEAIAQSLSVGVEDVAFAHLPLHYSYGLSLLSSHLARGAAVALTRHTLMERAFWARWTASGATSFPGVPTHYQLLARLGIKRLASPRLRLLTQAGGRLAPELVREVATQARALGAGLAVMYGQTEAGPRISLLPPELALEHAGSIGRPIPGVELSLRDERGEAVGEGVEGELVCRAPGIMLGYAEQADALALGDEQGGVLATGDLAVRDADGLYRITGRRSRFLKLMGNRVSLDHVEQLLQAAGYPMVAVGRDDWLCAVTEDPACDLAKVTALLVDRLSVPPRALAAERVERIPRSEAGKVLYGRLLATVRGKDGA